MLLVLYTPPAQGGYSVAQYQQAVRRRNERIRDDEATLLLLWWQLNKEFDNGKDTNASILTGEIPQS